MLFGFFVFFLPLLGVFVWFGWSFLQKVKLSEFLV